jgi:hypothetical protein
MATNWIIREDKLDKDQREFMQDGLQGNRNVWIKGYAGSGKSVLLIHSLLKKMKSEPNASMAIIVYTHSLIDMFRTGLHELGVSKNIPIITYYEYKKHKNYYDYIFCDETQDIPAYIVEMMANNSGQLIVAGDSNQSIFDNGISPSELESILNPRKFELTVIHRLTRSIINAVQKLIPGMNIWESKRDATKQDVVLRLGKASSERQEVKYIWREASKAASFNQLSAILLPSHDAIKSFVNILSSNLDKDSWDYETNRYGKPDYNSLNMHLGMENIPLEYVGNSYGSFEECISKKRVILMTYHSAKGMDFEHVFLPFCNTKLKLNPDNGKTVFMVALTRSRQNMYLTYTGSLHSYVEKFWSLCHEIDIEAELNRGQQATTSGTYGF